VTPTRLRPLAEADLVERTGYYRREAGDGVGAQFFDAAIAALGAIRRMPNAGSPRVGEVAGIDGLRARRIREFPCAWFYFVTEQQVDVVRLLHDAQDLPVVLADLEPDPPA
jgi:toxin ParE1/3/4